MKPTDNELISSYLKGNDEAFEQLTKRYLNALYRFVLGYVKDAHTAEDITQEVFVKIWKNLKKVDKDKNFKSWAYTVAKNTTLDFFKKKKAVPFSSFETEWGKNPLLEGLRDESQLPDTLSELKENQSIFLAALDQLSAKYKTVLSLYYYQFLNFREIAEFLKEPLNTIKSRHRRGLVLLEKIIHHGDIINLI